jgi:hypothetical protein
MKSALSARYIYYTTTRHGIDLQNGLSIALVRPFALIFALLGCFFPLIVLLKLAHYHVIEGSKLVHRSKDRCAYCISSIVLFSTQWTPNDFISIPLFIVTPPFLTNDGLVVLLVSPFVLF